MEFTFRNVFLGAQRKNFDFKFTAFSIHYPGLDHGFWKRQESHRCVKSHEIVHPKNDVCFV